MPATYLSKAGRAGAAGTLYETVTKNVTILFGALLNLLILTGFKV